LLTGITINPLSTSVRNYTLCNNAFIGDGTYPVGKIAKKNNRWRSAFLL